MAKQPLGGRPNKAALVRIKLATVVVSIAAFVGSLGVVAYVNPGIHSATAANSQTQSVSVASAPSSTSQLSNGQVQLPALQQQASVRPMTRTRGS